MTLRNIIDDLLEPVTGGHITYDHKLNEPDYLAYLIGQYRAKEIGDNFQRNHDTHSVWFQPLVNKVIAKVDKDEMNGMDSDFDYGKIDLPRLVQFKQRDADYLNRAVETVTDPTCNRKYYPTTFEKWRLISSSTGEDSRKSYFWIRGDQMYLKPLPKKIAMYAIYADPLKGGFYDNTAKESGQLIIGSQYTVQNGTIIHNGITYAGIKDFTAVTEDFTGSGIVYAKNKIRLLTMDDPYPLSENMMENIKSKIWVREFKLTLQTKKDEVTDAREEENQVRER